MKASWIFPETGPYQVQGRDLSEDNFAPEGRTNLEILIREVLQNPLDARDAGNSGPVKVQISVLKPGEFDHGYLVELLNGEFGKRLEASGGAKLPEMSTATVLVLEDFGTTGLNGSWNDQNADGSNENWNAFWFREGEGAKSLSGSNGRAGQGKITYYRISAARAVFGYTIRNSDGQSLLMGRSAFRKVYPFNGSKYLKHSFWCTGQGQALPVLDEGEILAFRQAFGLERKDEHGLSLVIPMPIDFEPKAAIQTIITEFYYPIACGNLEVRIGGMDIGRSNVDSVADHVLPDDRAREIRSAFTKGFRKLIGGTIGEERNGVTPVELKPGWDKASAIREEFFPEGMLGMLRGAIEKGDSISVRCPVTVRPKIGQPVQTWFDVHLQIPEDLDRVEEAYIRRDLLIGSETHLASSAHLQKARGLTLIKDAALSAFLADAEEPTHLKWNGSRPRLAEDYLNPQATLRAVRNAAPRLLSVISNGLVKMDVKALAKYFTKPAEEGKKHASGGDKKGGKETKEIIVFPAPVRRPFRIVTGKDRVHVLPNGTAAPKTGDLPMSCVLELAYEGLDQDPFKAYDPFDFNLTDEKNHAVIVAGANVTERLNNRIHFEVVNPDFSVEVQGFDQNIRLRARLNFTEKNDGTTIGEE
ncbi:MAG: hypothetical protein KJ850_05600 [Gammaproteobacteria bacterium]|nr:hypothetical protein [Gammaproteobacteria bacterium]MBU1624507.1 hypothetical protein [Gammaproteobacteria bacterium]MBU1982351.1 hypothetical protein [Gammaproteobacteria bacterium]